MEKLMEVLKHQGRTKIWLARALGCSERHVYNLLDGTTPWTEEYRRRIALALDVPESMLFSEGDGDETS